MLIQAGSAGQKTAPYGNPAEQAFFRSDASVRLFSIALSARSWLNSQETIFCLPGEQP
jgi:hypothetical protein